MRTLGDPDASPPTDRGVRRAISRLGQASGEPSAAALAERWRRWRAYATQHLWASLDPGSVTKLANNREVAT